MSATRLFVLLVFVSFLAFTGWAFANGGNFDDVMAQFGASPWSLQVTLDLCVALAIVCVGIWRDAQTRGTNPWPYIAMTPLVGSISPLLYLLLRSETDQV